MSFENKIYQKIMVLYRSRNGKLNGRKRFMHVEYDNPQKKHWRNRVWNVIDHAFGRGDKKDCVVLYLPGIKDLDREIAVKRKGFRAEKMFAVERDPAIAKELRGRKVPVIEGDLLDVLTAWPDDKPISLIWADFQCDLGEASSRLQALYLSHPALRRCVLAVNLQRGRGAAEVLQNHRKIQDYIFSQNADVKTGLTEKHRGRLFFGHINVIYQAEHLLKIVDGYVAALPEKFKIEYAQNPPQARVAAVFDQVKNRIVKEFPVFVHHLPGYRSTSKSPVFDCSVAFFPRQIDSKFLFESTPQIERAHRRISAALAVSTRRTRGELRVRYGDAYSFT